MINFYTSTIVSNPFYFLDWSYPSTMIICFLKFSFSSFNLLICWIRRSIQTYLVNRHLLVPFWAPPLSVVSQVPLIQGNNVNFRCRDMFFYIFFFFLLIFLSLRLLWFCCISIFLIYWGSWWCNNYPHSLLGILSTYWLLQFPLFSPW